MRRAAFFLPQWAAPLAILLAACGDGSSPAPAVPTVPAAPAAAAAPPAPADGLSPNALIEGHDGNLYGVTEVGGDFGAGTVFRATPQGQEAVLYSFSGGVADGASPRALLQGSDGNFYGVTGSGGIAACGMGPPYPPAAMGNQPIPCGTVFEVTPEGAETILYFFTGGTDGGVPTSLIQASDGYLYGTATAGGIANPATGAVGGGVVFRVAGPGSEQVLYAFDGSTGNGASPQSLMQASDGNFYVTTGEGGTAGFGAIVRVTASGAESVLHSFLGYADGVYPSAPLLEWSDGNLYGVTAYNGTPNSASAWFTVSGIFFRLTPAGQETILYQFGTDAAEGFNPLTLVAGDSGRFFGVTSNGGLLSACGGIGCGTVYQITPSGAESALYAFPPYIYQSTTAFSGVVAVIESADGTLYGITSPDGIATQTAFGGTLFSLSPGGVFTTLHAFGSGAAAP